MEKHVENEKWSRLVWAVMSSIPRPVTSFDMKVSSKFVASTTQIHDIGNETRKGMNADGTGKVFDGLWDRGHVEGRLYNFP